jgi:hypothetical protein
MFRRYERRQLAEIERQLCAEDPVLARKLTDIRPLTRVLTWLSACRALAVATAALSILCLFLGDGAGFLTTAVLAGALLMLNGWTVQAE